MFRYWINIRLAHIFVDFVLLLFIFCLVYFWRVDWVFSTDLVFQTFFLFSFLGCGLWIGFLMVLKYYRIPPRSGKRFIFDLGLMGGGGIIANSFMIVVYFFTRAELFSRWISVFCFFFGVLLLFWTRIIFLSFLRRAKRKEMGCYRTLIIGGNRIGERLVQSIGRNKYSLHKIVGVIDPYGVYKNFQGARVFGKLNKLETVCDEENITALIQCDAFEHAINLIALCEERGMSYEFDPALRGVFEDSLRVRETSGARLCSFHKEMNKNQQVNLKDRLRRLVFDVD